MADALIVLDHRNAGFLGHELHKAFAASRNDEVDVFILLQQQDRDLTIRVLDKRDRSLRDAGLSSGFRDYLDDGGIGSDGLGSPTQYHGVAGLETKGRRVRRHIGPGFIDDADDPDGNTHPADLHAVWTPSHSEDL